MPPFDEFDENPKPAASAAPAAANTPAPAAGDPAPPAPAPDTRLAELQAERDQLRARLESLSSGSKAQQNKLAELEAQVQRLANTKPADPPGPTPAQVVQMFDQKIAEIEVALEEAEASDPAKAPALRRQLRGLERKYNEYTTDVRLQQLKQPNPDDLAEQTAAQTRQQIEYENTRQRILVDYPMLDGDGEAPDIGLIEGVYDLYQPLLRGGMEPAKALQKAVKAVANEKGIKPASAVKPKAETKDEPKDEPAPVSAADKRKAAAIDKAIEAATNQPPNMAAGASNKGGDDLLSKYNFGKMSIDDFLRIPDDEQKRIEEALRRHQPEEA